MSTFTRREVAELDSWLLSLPGQELPPTFSQSFLAANAEATHYGNSDAYARNRWEVVQGLVERYHDATGEMLPSPENAMGPQYEGDRPRQYQYVRDRFEQYRAQNPEAGAGGRILPPSCGALSLSPLPIPKAAWQPAEAAFSNQGRALVVVPLAPHCRGKGAWPPPTLFRPSTGAAMSARRHIVQKSITGAVDSALVAGGITASLWLQALVTWGQAAAVLIGLIIGILRIDAMLRKRRREQLGGPISEDEA
jgi:hypothetical protein